MNNPSCSQSPPSKHTPHHHLPFFFKWRLKDSRLNLRIQARIWYLKVKTWHLTQDLGLETWARHCCWYGNGRHKFQLNFLDKNTIYKTGQRNQLYKDTTVHLGQHFQHWLIVVSQNFFLCPNWIYQGLNLEPATSNTKPLQHARSQFKDIQHNQWTKNPSFLLHQIKVVCLQKQLREFCLNIARGVFPRNYSWHYNSEL